MTTHAVNAVKENPRPEEAWHGADQRTLGALHAQMLDGGYSVAFANGLVGWIVIADSNAITAPTASGYRKALRELAPDGPRRRHRRRRESGHVDTMKLALAGSAATVGATSASLAGLHGPVAAFGAVVVPIILGPSRCDTSEGLLGLEMRRRAA